MSNILLPILTPWEDNIGGLGMPSLQFGWVHAKTIYQNGAQVAVLASPVFTGVPAAPTAAPGTNTTQLATTAFVQAAAGAEVSLAQLLAASTSKVLLGRNTAGAGDFEEVTATQLIDWIGTPAQGDLLYRGASAWAGLARPSGVVSFLKHLGTASNPLWAEYLAENDVDFAALIDATVDKRLIGAASAGAFGELTISAVLDWLGTAAQGDLLVRGASGWELVPRPGSPGSYYFGHDGTEANGAWSAYSSTAPTTANIWPIVSPFFTATSSIGWDVATGNQAKARILVATNGGLVGDANTAAALDYDNLTAESTIAGSDLVAFWDESAAAGAGAIRSCTVDQMMGAVGGPPFGDSANLLQNSTDPTKFAKFSAALITTGTTRTYSLPDKTMTFADDADVLYNDGTIAGTGRQQFEGLKFGAASTLTVAAGVITVVDKGWYQVAGEGAASDDLNTISGLAAGEWCFLQAADDAQTITFKHGVDNLSAIGNADVALDDLHDMVIAFHNGVDITIAPFGGGSAGGSTFADDVFRVKDDGDATKQIAFQASAITTATTRTITMPDADVDLTLVTNASQAAATFDTDNAIVRADGTSRGVQKSAPTINDSGTIETSAGIYFTERADHVETPAATKGELWVKNTVPNTLIFTDDAGTDIDLTATGSGIASVAADTTPQLGGDLDLLSRGLFKVYTNNTGGTIGTNAFSLTAVKAHSTDGEMAAADNTDENIIGVVYGQVTNGSTGNVYYEGTLLGDTNGVYSQGAALYVPTTANTNLTSTAPTTGKVIKIAVVEDETSEEVRVFSPDSRSANTVANGLSGRATATAYAVICGGTTSTAAHQSIASVGSTGQLLTSNGAGALPTMQGSPEVIQIACSDETTALTTGTAKATFRMPFAMTLSAVRASVTTAPTGAILIVDINESGTTLMTTNKLSIDATEKTSTTAATAATLTDTALADDAEITIDIDQVGSSVAGAGLKVSLIGIRA